MYKLINMVRFSASFILYPAEVQQLWSPAVACLGHGQAVCAAIFDVLKADMPEGGLAVCSRTGVSMHSGHGLHVHTPLKLLSVSESASNWPHC